MSGNRDVVYLGPGKVEVQSTSYLKTQDLQGRQVDHGVVLWVVSTSICGSDQHMVRSRTTTLEDLVLGHEITSEVVETGRGTETMKTGGLVSIPLNVVCDHCHTRKEQHTDTCLTVNPAWAGDTYGYIDTGGWVSGRAECMLVPYVDFDLLKLSNREAVMEKIRDLTCLSDIFPTSYYGVITVGVDPGNMVYVIGAGSVGLTAVALARLLGAAVATVGDVNPIRLVRAKKRGFEIADLSKDTPLHGQIAALLDKPEVDCTVDTVGFEARGHGHSGSQQETLVTMLNSLMGITRVAGEINIPGLYVTEDPGTVSTATKHGALSIRFGLGWVKPHSFHTDQTPMMKYNRQLMQAIMWDRIKIADIVGVEVIILGDAPKGYGEFDARMLKKFVIDPHNLLRAA